MSGYQYYGSMDFNGNPYGYGNQPMYPPLLYAHDPSMIKDELDSDGGYLLSYSNTSDHPSENSSSPEQITSEEVEKSLPSPAETERFLREYLTIFEPRPLNLYSLPDCPDLDHKRPPIIALIALAIWASPQKKLSLRQIHDAVEERYPSWSASKDKPWQRSIRHSLSLKAMFRHENREGSTNPKYGFWHLNVAYQYANKRLRTRNASKDGSQSSISERDSDEYEPPSQPQSAGFQRQSNPDSSMLRGTISRHAHDHSGIASSNDVYTRPHATQMGNIHGHQLDGAMEYHGYHQSQQVPDRMAFSYVFVPEAMHHNAIPQRNTSYSNYPGPAELHQMSEQPRDSSMMSYSDRRRTGPTRDMESQMPKRTPRSRRTD